MFFFLAEYTSIVIISTLTSILFLGGYLYPYDSIISSFNHPVIEGALYGLSLGFKTCVLVFCFIWTRASFPRVRFDQLMSLCWTVLLPLVFAFIILVPVILISFDAVPSNIGYLFIPCLVVSQLKDDKKGDENKPLPKYNKINWS